MNVYSFSNYLAKFKVYQSDQLLLFNIEIVYRCRRIRNFIMNYISVSRGDFYKNVVALTFEIRKVLKCS